jgi:hypothetical protein
METSKDVEVLPIWRSPTEAPQGSQAHSPELVYPMGFTGIYSILSRSGPVRDWGHQEDL